MNDDELERLLSGAFDARARSEVGDDVQPPPPRFAGEPAVPVHRRWAHRGAPLLAAAAVLILVLTVAFVSFRSDDGKRRTADPGPVTSTSHSSESSAPLGTGGTAASSATPVHIKLLNADGADYGVGMPVIAYFSRKIKSGKALQDATRVTVDGVPAQGAWYFEHSKASKSYPVEGHFRLENYWPANSKIHLDIPAAGLSAGKGMAYDDSLTLDFTTHDRIVSTVDDSSHRMTVVDNGTVYGTFPVSLGAQNTPTLRGVKVIMEKGRDISMRGPGYVESHVQFTQRLTYGGEYLHAAPWNKQIGKLDSSNGCTNLTQGDAKKLYGFLGVGDVVQYPNADGPAMTLGAGYGDWNINWSTWRTGGLVRTS